MEGIARVAPGNTFGDIGATIQRYAEAHRCSVVRDFCGHGSDGVPCQPNVLHYGRAGGSGPVLEPGMFFTIEPMVNLAVETKVLDDDWTAVTKDRSLSAQFEHSVGVTETGVGSSPLSPAKAGSIRPGTARSRRRKAERARRVAAAVAAQHRSAAALPIGDARLVSARNSGGDGDWARTAPRFKRKDAMFATPVLRRPRRPGTAGTLIGFAPIVLIFAIMYFLMIRRSRRR